ncbi:MAG: Uncharacterised protein [Rhodothermaeota bacterium MED-G12]|nr:MAG: Uncharacterised protein [Rhodothermaeota bacterium MED-G12]
MKIAHFLLFILTLVLLNCDIKSSNDEYVIAKVNNDVLLQSELMQKIPPQQFALADSAQIMRDYTQQWIMDRILLQEAYRLRIHREKEVMDKINELTEDYILQISKDYITKELNPDVTVSIDEARDYYQENKDNFLLNERFIRFRFFKTNSLNEASRARQELLRGSDWENVVRSYALQPEYTLDHSERFWPITRAASDSPIMNRYLQRIGLSEISVIEKVGNEYHFVQLLEEKPKGEHPDLEWLLSEIQQWLLLEKKRTSFKSYQQNLYLQAEANNEIEIKLPN